MSSEIDEGFVKRVFRTSLWVGGFLGLLLLVGRGTAEGISFCVGAVMSLGLLRALEYTIRRFLVPGKPKASRALLAVVHTKYLLVAICFYFLVQSSWLRPGWLAVGIGLVQAVIVLKALGILLVNWMNRSQEGVDVSTLIPPTKERER